MSLKDGTEILGIDHQRSPVLPPLTPSPRKCYFPFIPTSGILEVLMTNLTTQLHSDLAGRGVSRRNFGRIAAMLSAGATLPLFTEPGLAQLSQIRGKIPDDAVMINSNENPLGPCPE